MYDIHLNCVLCVLVTSSSYTHVLPLKALGEFKHKGGALFKTACYTAEGVIDEAGGFPTSYYKHIYVAFICKLCDFIGICAWWMPQISDVDRLWGLMSGKCI